MDVFGVAVQFCLLTGEGESHHGKDALEVCMGQFNHPYKIHQPGKRDVVWWQKLQWAAHLYKQSPLEQEWCYWLTDDI